MSDYTITTDFGAKDSLPSGNAAKIIKGSEFTTEFTNIKTAVNTKADTAGDTFTGAVTFDAAVTVNSTATITGDLTVDTNTLFVDVSEAKVGIGTSNPAESLHTSGNIRLGDTTPAEIYTNSNELRLGVDRNNDNADSDITFYTNNDEKVRIDSSGNVLVGKTSASFNAAGIELAPTGNINATRNSNECINLNRLSTGGNMVKFYKDGTTVGSISVTASTTSYNTSSDERLKENIADSADAGSKVDAIQIRQFDWKADGSHQDYGVIAQELVTVAPEAVSEGDTEEDMMGVDYSKLVPMLIKEVQSLRSRVAELENV